MVVKEVTQNTYIICIHFNGQYMIYILGDMYTLTKINGGGWEQKRLKVYLS